MARDWNSGCWAAAATLCSGEYAAKLELERLGLHPYLPQYKREWLPPHHEKRQTGRPVARYYPLFPGYLFLPYSEARARELTFVPKLQHPRPLLSSAEGRLWTVSADDIFTLARIENEGSFDETVPMPGEKVRMKSGKLPGVEMLLARSSGKFAELFTPLFGGCRGATSMENVVRTG